MSVLTQPAVLNPVLDRAGLGSVQVIGVQVNGKWYYTVKWSAWRIEAFTLGETPWTGSITGSGSSLEEAVSSLAEQLDVLAR